MNVGGRKTWRKALNVLKSQSYGTDTEHLYSSKEQDGATVAVQKLL